MPTAQNPTVVTSSLRTPAGDRRHRPPLWRLAAGRRSLRRHDRRHDAASGRTCAGADIPGRRPVEIGCGRRARRLGRLPAAFQPAHPHCPQDGERRHAVSARRTLRPAGAERRSRAILRSTHVSRRSARASRWRARYSPVIEFNSHPHVPFLWLKLSEPWLSGTFKHAAFEEGVLVDDEDEFKAGRTDSVFHRVRIGFSSPRRPQRGPARPHDPSPAARQRPHRL